ncbi:MAG: hypothetical protein J6S14_13425 [Clostridia bacterium]|nr:hypothetical protein [Clostridia bacterium]
MNLFELSAKIMLDDTEFKKSMKNASETSKTVAKAMKNLQSPIGKVQSAFQNVKRPVESAKAGFEALKSKTESLRHPIETLKKKFQESATALETKRNKLSTLSAAYDSAKKKVKDLTKEFNKSAKENGTASNKTQELARRLNEAEKEAADAKKDLDEYAKSVSKAGKSSDSASSKVSKFGQALGSGLKTSAKVGATAVATAAAAVAALTKLSITSFSEYEQLAGGVEKIFDRMDTSKIMTDAANAYKNLGLSANQYLSMINNVGATFASTMGDKAGYENAKRGLQAISDFASGTGGSIDELSDKFMMITRSTSTYQSIADQFSGILPATSADFLKQAQAAGLLSKKYEALTEVPVAEYQKAVTAMLERGVDALGLTGNTANEAMTTLSGSFAMAKSSWNNLVTGMSDDSADLDLLIGNFVESVGAVAENLMPKIGTALNGAATLVRDLIPVIVQEIPVLIEENLPVLAAAAISIIQSLIDGISQNQEMLMTTAFEVITYLASSLITMLPQIVSLGFDLLISLANGIASSLPELIPTIVDVVLKIVEVLTNPESLGQLLDAALTIMIQLAYGLMDAIPQLLDAGYEVMNSLIAFLLDPANLSKIINAALHILIALGTGLVKAIPLLLTYSIELMGKLVESFKSANWSDVGKNIIAGIKSGISKAWSNLKSWFKGLFGDLIGIAKKILGIASPSKVFKQLGSFTTEGLQLGLEQGAGDIFKTVEGIADGVTASFNPNLSTDFGVRTYSGSGAWSSSAGGHSAQPAVTRVVVGIDDSANAMGFARALLPLLKIAEKEAYA